MKAKTAVASFFNRIPGVLGYIGGGGWGPSGTVEGVAPFGRVGSDAGPTVEAGSALQVDAVFACVRLRASTIATLPLVLTDLENGKRVPQVRSPLYRMLTLSPNADMTAIDFWKMMVASLDLWGNAYAVKGKIVDRTVSLTPLRPEFMTVARNRAGAIVYRYQPTASGMREYVADEILHIKGDLTADGLTGMSIIAMARQTIGRAIATDTASGKVFKSGMSASGMIQYDKSFKTPEQREEIRKSIESFTGSENTGKVMVLENGMTYQGIQMSSKDAQLLESRMFNVETICRWFGVPPQLVGHVLKSSSWASSIESTTIGFKTYNLRPVLRAIEQAVTKSLRLSATQRLAYDLSELDCADSAALAALDASRVQNGLRTRNELRARDNLDAIEGADELTVQSNLMPLARMGDVIDAAVRPPPAPVNDSSKEPPK